ncbi:putative iron-regulated protein [Sedimentisphaera cyanobacteriorum]|uniref:Putative iron-regulated protein n=1 Tax=Sedimentisphaera cyanobacteriorum TaxID=1940790 RepID=A0A1Q2HQX8_9BACT|nr:ChaN family lipoprotein [Sedimentisphaera cyanobacteriorum]AQQ09858.1 putative iron-regulated protein [Sedimentisphaera cyanobacteriorum]
MNTNVGRYGFWVDAYIGEPIAYDELVTDLSQVDIVYLGERHTLKRHHDIQQKIITELILKDKHIILGLEQFEAFQQPIIEKYNRSEITLDQLTEQTDWPSRWSNYLDYCDIVKAVHDAGGEVVGLNARQEIVRKVARKGMDSLTNEERNELPVEIDTSNESYRQHMNNTMMVMAHVKNNPDMLDRMFTAQVCRDEMMAESLYKAIKSSEKQNSIAVVLCGSGHLIHGSGIPSRLKRRLPNLKDRIVVLSGSGDVELSKSMQAMSRDVKTSHQQLKCFETPVADYLHVVNLDGQLDKY